MISQLNQRERIFVTAGGVALVLALLYLAVLMPYRSALTRLDKQIAVRSQQLQEVKSLRAQYLAMQQQILQVEMRVKNSQDFSALTFIENLVERTAGRDNLVVNAAPAPLDPKRIHQLTRWRSNSKNCLSSRFLNCSGVWKGQRRPCRLKTSTSSNVSMTGPCSMQP